MEQDWAVIHDFLSADIVAALAKESHDLYANHKMQAAGVGQGAEHRVHNDIRGDHVYWLDEQDATPAQAHYWRRAAALRATLNEELFLSLVSLEAHFAVYAPKAFYRKHLDRFAHNSQRVISCCLYLNADWQADYGDRKSVV